MQLFHIPKARFRHNYHHNGKVSVHEMIMEHSS